MILEGIGRLFQHSIGGEGMDGWPHRYQSSNFWARFPGPPFCCFEYLIIRINYELADELLMIEFDTYT